MEKTRFRMWSQNQNDRIWIYLLYKLLIFHHPFQAGCKVSTVASIKKERIVLYMSYENRIKFFEEQIEALLYNIEEKEKGYIYEQVRIIKQKIEDFKK